MATTGSRHVFAKCSSCKLPKTNLKLNFLVARIMKNHRVTALDHLLYTRHPTKTQKYQKLIKHPSKHIINNKIFEGNQVVLGPSKTIYDWTRWHVTPLLRDYAAGCSVVEVLAERSACFSLAKPPTFGGTNWTCAIFCADAESASAKKIARVTIAYRIFFHFLAWLSKKVSAGLSRISSECRFSKLMAEW